MTNQSQTPSSPPQQNAMSVVYFYLGILIVAGFITAAFSEESYSDRIAREKREQIQAEKAEQKFLSANEIVRLDFNDGFRHQAEVIKKITKAKLVLAQGWKFRRAPAKQGKVLGVASLDWGPLKIQIQANFSEADAKRLTLNDPLVNGGLSILYSIYLKIETPPTVHIAPGLNDRGKKDRLLIVKADAVRIEPTDAYRQRFVASGVGRGASRN